MSKENFEHNLIKGKIAELIFELMFRESQKFSVFRFGYEYTAEYIAQHRLETKFSQVIENISNAPDFVLITQDKNQVYLVEVKYRGYPQRDEIIQIAEEISRRWNPAYLFILSKDGFYFTPTNTIINQGGNIEPLSLNWISQEIQSKYKKLAEDYLWHHED